MKNMAQGSFQKCVACSAQNELPFLFCSDCGAPRFHLSRMRVTYSLSIIFSVLLGSAYYREQIGWNWPLYLVSCIFLTQFALSLVAGSRRHVIRFNIWHTLFLLAGLGFFYLLRSDQMESIFGSLRDLPDDMVDQPILSAAISLGILLMFAVPAYIRWGRIYGWVNAYRLIILCLVFTAGIALSVLRVMQWAYDTEAVAFLSSPEVGEFLSERKPLFDKYLSYSLLSLLRVFVFEIVIFAAVRGYALVHAGEKQAPLPRMAKGSGFERSLFHIAQITRRFLLALENTVRYVVVTISVLAVDMGKVLVVFAREILFPSLALCMSAYLLYRFVNYIDLYVDSNRWRYILPLVGCVVGLLLCSMVFLGCKAPYRWGRIVAFKMQLIGWLLPNLLIFFLLLSCSLSAASAAANHFDGDGRTLPFRIGLLTKFSGGFLAILVAVILIRKRSVFFSAPQPGQEPQLAAAGAPGPANPAESGAANGLPEKANAQKLGLIAYARESVARKKEALVASAKQAAEALELDKKAQAARATARNVADYVQGKPDVVDRLARLDASIIEKNRQMQALESTRESISAQTYDKLRAQCEADLLRMHQEHAQAAADWNRQEQAYTEERDKLRKELGQIEIREKEIQRLFEARAIDKNGLHSEERLIRQRSSLLRAQLRETEKILAFFHPEMKAPPANNPDIRI